MLKKYKDILKDFKFYVPFLAMLVFFLFLYQMDFPQGDDFFFTAVGGSMDRIWRFYVQYYFSSGSRMANMLAQIFLLSGLTVWKIATPFIIEGISLLIYYYTAGSLPGNDAGPRRKDMALACLCAVFPGTVPVIHHVFADTFIWMDGSCNYIYPAFLVLLGFAPFYNTVRGRRIPRKLLYISPVCLLTAALMHEQAALMAAAMCIVCLIYFHKEGHITRYFAVVSCLTFAVLIYTVTAPGAYMRLGRVGTAGLSVQSRLAVNLLSYLYPFASDCWPWTVLMGACALLVMHYKESRSSPALYFIIFFGMVLSSFTGMLMFPGMQEYPFGHGCNFHSVFGCVEGAFLIVYFAVVFAVFLSAAKNEKKYRYLTVLYTGMWASQGIPAVLGVKGRPLLYLVVLALLLAVSLFWDNAGRSAHTAYILKYAAYSVSAIALVTLANAVPHMRSNMAEYKKIESQVSEAEKGKTDEVRIDKDKFDYYYAYYNSFSPRYTEDIRVYFKLPKNVKIIIK